MQTDRSVVALLAGFPGFKALGTDFFADGKLTGIPLPWVPQPIYHMMACRGFTHGPEPVEPTHHLLAGQLTQGVSFDELFPATLHSLLKGN